MALKTITFLRPSGSTIELQNTKEMRKFAKDNKWKIKKEQPQLTGEDNGDSSASGEGDTSGDTGTSD